MSEACPRGPVGQDTYRVIFNPLVHDILIKAFTWFVTKKGPKGPDLKPVEVYLSLSLTAVGSESSLEITVNLEPSKGVV